MFESYRNFPDTETPRSRRRLAYYQNVLFVKSPQILLFGTIFRSSKRNFRLTRY